jgi:hypothetical protein
MISPRRKVTDHLIRISFFELFGDYLQGMPLKIQLAEKVWRSRFGLLVFTQRTEGLFLSNWLAEIHLVLLLWIYLYFGIFQRNNVQVSFTANRAA